LRSFLLFVALCIATFTHIHAKRKSKKYFKAKKFPFGYPVGVCYPRQVDADFVSSIKLVCQEDPTDCPLDGSECERMVVAQRYETDDCSGSIQSTDRFKHIDRSNYPFNCYERAELNDESFTADPDDYEVSYVVVKMTRGLEVEVNNETLCGADPDADFYRTFPAITDRCMMGWRDIDGDGNDEPEFYLTRCHDTAVEVLTFAKKDDCREYNFALSANDDDDTATNWTALEGPTNTLYSENGCDDREMGYAEGTGVQENNLWYTEVMECSHPDYTISAAVYTRAGVYMLVVVATLVLYGM